MKVCRTIELEDVVTILRCEALKKWISATDTQRESIWELINDTLGANGNIPTESEINDFIWFNCDEIFYPEESSDEDDEYYDEENEDDEISF